MPRFHWHISDVHHERVDLSKKWRACSFAKGTYTSQRWSNVILSAPIRGAMGDIKHLTSNWSSWGLNLSSMVFTEEHLEILRLPLFVRSFVARSLVYFLLLCRCCWLVCWLLKVLQCTSQFVPSLMRIWDEYPHPNSGVDKVSMRGLNTLVSEKPLFCIWFHFHCCSLLLFFTYSLLLI